MRNCAFSGKMSSTFFLSVPAEVWEKISAHLSVIDLSSCELVSKRYEWAVSRRVFHPAWSVQRVSKRIANWSL